MADEIYGVHLSLARYFCKDRWARPRRPAARQTAMHNSLILGYGRDQRLLETRSWVLEQAGYRVVQAMTLAEVEALAEIDAVAVAMLCHSLSAEESQAALTSLRRLRPDIQRLVLTVNATAVSDGEQEAVLSAYEGPRRLLEEVARMAQRQEARQ